MKKNSSRQTIWFRATRKYQKLQEAAIIGTSVRRKLDILRRRILRLNRIWKLGIATTSLMAWLNAPALAQFPASFDLSSLDGTNGFTINGSVNAASGRSVSSAGDINGDGIDDLIVSQHQTGAGITHVIFGSSMGGFSTGELELSALNGTNGFSIYGIDSGDASGQSASGAGDVNGDGIDDIIIGAPNAARVSTQIKKGESYVVFGNSTGGFSTGSFQLSVLNGSNGFLISNGFAGGISGIGFAVSNAGDVNGDGVDDVIIGHPDSNNRIGSAYIIFGSTSGGFNSGTFDLTTLDGTNGFIFDGRDNFGRFGADVSSAGDINGDGIDDIVVAGPSAYAGGISAVLFGSSTSNFNSGSLSIDDINAVSGINGLKVRGDNLVDGPNSVSNAGDINGDGVDDIIIGAANSNQSGRSFVVFGSSTGNLPSILFLSSTNGTNGVTLNGVNAGDRTGNSVSGISDINGDGIDDVIIGASNSNSNAGTSYVVFGGSTGALSSSTFELSSLDGSNGFTLNGINTDDYSGISVSDAGDVNGDGGKDFIIGAWLADPNGNNIGGSSYVVFGQPCVPVATPEISIAVSPAQIQESVSQIAFTFTASVSPTCSDLSINFSASGTATFNNDYTLVSGSTNFNGSTGTITIPQGQTSVNLVFEVQQDTAFEPDETIIVTVTP